MLGEPLIRGTRIPGELVIRKLSEGATEADLLDAYPRLTQADIRHCCATGRLRWLMLPTYWPTKSSCCKRPDECFCLALPLWRDLLRIHDVFILASHRSAPVMAIL